MRRIVIRAAKPWNIPKQCHCGNIRPSNIVEVSRSIPKKQELWFDLDEAFVLSYKSGSATPFWISRLTGFYPDTTDG